MNEAPLPVDTGDVIEARFVLYEALERSPWKAVFEARKVEPPRDWVTFDLLRHRGPEVSESALIRLSSIQESQVERALLIAQRIGNPHIIPALEHGTTEDGHLYTIYARNEGHTLFHHLAQRGPLGRREGLHLMRRVLAVLADTHAAGLVHGRLEPGNLFVMDTVVDKGLRVTGFGLDPIVRATYPGLDDLHGAWAPILGPAAYIPPEVLRGHEPLPQSDLYAWALILIECITGSPLPPLPDPASVTARHLDPAPHSLPDAIADTNLAPFLQRLLAKRPEERPSTAREALQELDALGASNVFRALPSGVLPIVTEATDDGPERPTFFNLTAVSADTSPEVERRSRLFLAVALTLVIASIGVVLLLDSTDAPEGADDSANTVAEASPETDAPPTTATEEPLEPVEASPVTPDAAEAEPPDTVDAPADSEANTPVVEAAPAREALSINAPREELERLCEAGRRDACVRFAERLQLDQRWASSKKAADLLTAGCDAQHTGSCVVLARAMVRGQGVSQEPRDAFRLIEGLCQEGHHEACFEQARMHIAGDGTTQSRSRAEAVYQALCEESVTQGCVQLALTLDVGELEREYYLETLLPLHTRACEAGDGEGCLYAAKYHRDGYGVLPDKPSWIRYLRRGCELGNGESCTYLGEEYRDGPNLEIDITSALASFARACALNDDKGCTRLCGMHLYHPEVEGSPDVAFNSCEKGCLLGDAKSCRRTAQLLKDGTGTEQDFSRARRYQKMACEGGEEKACD